MNSVDEDSYVVPGVPLYRRMLDKVYRRAVPAATACTLRVSPCGRHLAALHLSGAVSVWNFPSLTRSKYWQLKDQPEATAVNILLTPQQLAVAEALRKHTLKRKGSSFTTL